MQIGAHEESLAPATEAAARLLPGVVRLAEAQCDDNQDDRLL